jgi:hypothetical protein
MNQATANGGSVHSLEIRKEIAIAAPVEIAWQAMLDQIGPLCELEPGKSMHMRLEAWPGGRYYRDLGEGTGHLWGHVQVIKPPTLLELCGPMFMSYAAISHVQYRLTKEGDGTLLTLVHTAVGLITGEHRENVRIGWEEELASMKALAEERSKK